MHPPVEAPTTGVYGDPGGRVVVLGLVALARSSVIEGNAAVALREVRELELPHLREADEAGDEEYGVGAGFARLDVVDVAVARLDPRHNLSTKLAGETPRRSTKLAGDCFMGDRRFFFPGRPFFFRVPAFGYPSGDRRETPSASASRGPWSAGRSWRIPWSCSRWRRPRNNR